MEESPSQLKHVSWPLRGWVSVSNGCKLWIGCLVGDYQESNVAFSHVLDVLGMLTQKQLATKMFKGVLENES